MKVLLGMSGGVDSTAAAILLKEQGYEVIGATMILHDNGCGSINNNQDAKIVCDKLGIKHYTFDFRKEFKKYVIDNFIQSYKQGFTPNPCIECNKFLKFNLFYEKAKELGCEFIATGHYAKTEFSQKYNTYVVRKSNSTKKDQSYVLYNIPKELVEKVIFPLGEFETKDQIRKIASDYAIHTANKPDSQEICFIEDNDYVRFIKENADYEIVSGNIKDMDGKVRGKHEGIINYTVGQRKGLGIQNKTPLYVVDINAQTNEVTVGEKQDIFKSELWANDINLLLPLKENMEIKAKIRYNSTDADAKIEKIQEDSAKITFVEPQKAITKGQSVVFYDNDGILIGGGKIYK